MHLMLHASQVGLYPGSSAAGFALVGPGPLLEKALHVDSFFLPQPEGWQDGRLSWILATSMQSFNAGASSAEIVLQTARDS